MSNFNNVDLLDIIEAYAEDNNLISSEDELSMQFDNDIAPLVIEQYGKDDIPAMSEAFNNWTDSLCKGGDLHDVQYNNYCYVGLYSE